MAAKVPSDRLDLAKALTDQGFYLADTNLQFRKLAEAGVASASAIVCRPATPADEGEVVTLAGSSFRFSRFHLDANIGSERANVIKAEWTRNFFRGKRGTAMFLATAEGRVTGFVLLLSGAAGECVIDLIAVGESHRQRGVARRLCLAAEEHAGAGRAMLVGTQAVNTPAAGLYTSMGYRLAAAQYVFHFWA